MLVLTLSITPSGNNTAGEQYQLICAVDTSTNNAPNFSWLGPPDGGLLPSGNSDTGMVSDVFSNGIPSGFIHSSILQFDPLQSSHEGNYTCQIEMGNVTEMRSIQVNVEGKS